MCELIQMRNGANIVTANEVIWAPSGCTLGIFIGCALRHPLEPTLSPLRYLLHSAALCCKCNAYNVSNATKHDVDEAHATAQLS